MPGPRELVREVVHQQGDEHLGRVGRGRGLLASQHVRLRKHVRLFRRCAYRHGALKERRVCEIVDVPPDELAPKRRGVFPRMAHRGDATRCDRSLNNCRTIRVIRRADRYFGKEEERMRLNASLVTRVLPPLLQGCLPSLGFRVYTSRRRFSRFLHRILRFTLFRIPILLHGVVILGVPSVAFLQFFLNPLRNELR